MINSKRGFCKKGCENDRECDIILELSYRYSATRGGVWMEVIVSFIIAVMTSVVSHCISKWLDSRDSKDN